MPDADAARPTTTWSYPTTVWFGAGGLARAGDACREAGITRPLLVTDPVLAKLPPVQAALASLAAAGLPTGLFTEVKPNPVAANVAAGTAALQQGGHDGVLAIGGGSALDAGKVIAFMAGQQHALWDFEDRDDRWRRADATGIRPVVAVPTTAGTGSEVGRAGVITDEATLTKRIIFHPAMLPRIAILDPEATTGLSPALTAATGMDALAHCLEAYCAAGFHPMAEGIAVEGMRLIREALPLACREGGDLGARGRMLAASAMGATAFQKGLGAIHSLSHPLGAVYDTHHGLTNAILMPYVVAFNRPAIEARLERLAAWLGLRHPGGDAVLDWILQLRAELGLPHSLKELGISDERIEELARMAVVDPTAGGNPRPLTIADARELLARAWAGRLA